MIVLLSNKIHSRTLEGLYIRELLMAKSRISVAPHFSSSSMIRDDSFLRTNADTATAVSQEVVITVHFEIYK